LQIIVAPAIKVKIVDEHVKEAEIGRQVTIFFFKNSSFFQLFCEQFQLTVPVALYSSTSMPFSNCAKFPFTFELSDEVSTETFNLHQVHFAILN
jgi:hypothetical protein